MTTTGPVATALVNPVAAAAQPVAQAAATPTATTAAVGQQVAPILTNLRIEGFKRIQNVSLALANVNILVGANGSGKSSILQAVHLACCIMRQAKKVAKTTSTISTEELDYLPTDNYETLGHGNNWGNSQNSPSTKVTLSFDNGLGSTIEANCTLRAARNAGISITGTIDPLLSKLRKKDEFFSAYIPGISGIPNKEDRRSKKVLLKACSFGDSNVILRNALLQLQENGGENIPLIEKWIGEIMGPIGITVKHDNDNDLYVTCDIQLNGQSKPIELVGTGYLQLIQLFCYILLFNPALLLIDEPDIHLYPEIQEKLVSALGEIARERGIKILLTTHSPFIVRGAPADANVYWLKDGAEESNNRELIETTLGWGAFGKSVILVSEDTHTNMLRALVAQWPELNKKIAFFPGTGYQNLLSAAQAKELTNTLGNKFKVLIHRDRDSLTDDEATILEARYQAAGADIWLSAESDVEAYFCSPQFISTQCSISLATAQNHLDSILTSNAAPISQQFEGQRGAHNQEFYATGGSPENVSVWTSFQTRPLKGAKGKFIYKKLKSLLNGKYNDQAILVSAAENGNLALDLKAKLLSLV